MTDSEPTQADVLTRLSIAVALLAAMQSEDGPSPILSLLRDAKEHIEELQSTIDSMRHALMERSE